MRKDMMIVISSLMSRKLNALLSVLLVAAGVALCAILLAFSHHLDSRMGRDGVGFDLVIGAKGSPLQTVLSSVYHIDIPTGNIPAAELKKWTRHNDVAKAIPLALGDSYKGYRIVGTSPDYIVHYKGEFHQGRIWNKPFEAVAGAATGLKVGDRFHGAHGLGDDGHNHEEQSYNVIGVLEETGTVLDRLILTSVVSVQDLHPHDGGHGHEGHHDHAHHEDEGDITAILLQTRNKISNINLPRQINKDGAIMAVNPAYEMTRLSSMLGIGGKTMAMLSAILLSISLLGVFAGLNAAMEGRMNDLAIFRAIGFSRWRLMRLVAIEGMLIVCAGIIAGMAAGIAGMEILSSMFAPIKTSGGLSVPWPSLAGLTAAVLSAGLAACAFPAWRAGKINVAEQLARGV